MLGKGGEEKHPSSAIAHRRNVMAKAGRHRAVFELVALPNALNGFKPCITESPRIRTMIDSRTARHLLSSGSYLSRLETRRYSVLVQTEYANVLFHLVPSGQNLADLLTWLYELPKRVEDRLKHDRAEILPVPASDDKLLGYTELTAFIKDVLHLQIGYPERIDKMNGQSKKTQKLKVSLISETAVKAFESSNEGIKLLEQRLTLADFLTEQQLPDFSDDTASSDLPQVDANFKKEDALIKYAGKLHVSPSLEVLLVAFLHLASGRSGSHKLLALFRSKHYMPRAKEKINSSAQRQNPAKRGLHKLCEKPSSDGSGTDLFRGSCDGVLKS